MLGGSLSRGVCGKYILINWVWAHDISHQEQPAKTLSPAARMRGSEMSVHRAIKSNLKNHILHTGF